VISARPPDADHWTDGQDSLEAMARAARDADLEYVAITDHTVSLP